MKLMYRPQNGVLEVRAARGRPMTINVEVDGVRTHFLDAAQHQTPPGFDEWRRENALFVPLQLERRLKPYAVRCEVRTTWGVFEGECEIVLPELRHSGDGVPDLEAEVKAWLSQELGHGDEAYMGVDWNRLHYVRDRRVAANFLFVLILGSRGNASGLDYYEKRIAHGANISDLAERMRRSEEGRNKSMRHLEDVAQVNNLISHFADTFESWDAGK